MKREGKSKDDFDKKLDKACEKLKNKKHTFENDFEMFLKKNKRKLLNFFKKRDYSPNSLEKQNLQIRLFKNNYTDIKISLSYREEIGIVRRDRRKMTKFEKQFEMLFKNGVDRTEFDKAIREQAY